MSGNQLARLPQQQTLAFSRNKISLHLPRAIRREIQALLAQMLLEVVCKESENETRRGEHERQAP